MDRPVIMPSSASAGGCYDARGFARSTRLSTAIMHSANTHTSHASPARPSPASARRLSRRSPSLQRSMTEDEFQAIQSQLNEELENCSEEDEECEDENVDSHIVSDIVDDTSTPPSAPFTPTRANVSSDQFSSPLTISLLLRSHPRDLAMALIDTEKKLKEREQQIAMAARFGQDLLQSQEEIQSQNTAYEKEIEDLKSNVEFVRQELSNKNEELEGVREKYSALTAQVKELSSDNNSLITRVNDLASELESVQSYKEKDSAHDKQKQLQSSEDLLDAVQKENLFLQSRLVAQGQSMRALQDRVQSLVSERDSARSEREEAQLEINELFTVIDARDADHAAAKAHFEQQIEALQSRQQLSLPSVTESRQSLGESDYAGLFPENFDAATMGVSQPITRNKRLSMMAYNSLLNELENELQQEVAVSVSVESERADENVNTNRKKMSRASTVSKKVDALVTPVQAASSVKRVSPKPPAVPVIAEERKPASYMSWFTSKLIGDKPAVANTLKPPSPVSPQQRAQSPTSRMSDDSPQPQPQCKPSPYSNSKRNQNAGNVDVLKEYFHLATLAVKMNSIDTNIKACNAHTGELYAQVIREDVPFHTWHAWISDKLARLAHSEPQSQSKRRQSVTVKPSHSTPTNRRERSSAVTASGASSTRSHAASQRVLSNSAARQVTVTPRRVQRA